MGNRIVKNLIALTLAAAMCLSNMPGAVFASSMDVMKYRDSLPVTEPPVESPEGGSGEEPVEPPANNGSTPDKGGNDPYLDSGIQVIYTDPEGILDGDTLPVDGDFYAPGDKVQVLAPVGDIVLPEGVNAMDGWTVEGDESGRLYVGDMDPRWADTYEIPGDAEADGRIVFSAVWGGIPMPLPTGGTLAASTARPDVTLGAELVTNGDMSSTTGGWLYVESTGSKNAEIGPESSYISGGSGANKVMEINATANGSAYQRVSLTAGEEYLLSFRYSRRTNPVSSDTMFVSFLYGSSASYTTLRAVDGANATGVLTGPSGFAAYYVRFTPDKTGTYNLSFNAVTPTNGGGNILDDVSLKPIVNNDIYVQSTGSDTTGTGAADKPFATLAKAYSVASAGGTIHVVGEVAQPAAANISVDKNITLLGESGGRLVRQPGNTGSFVTLTAGAVTVKDLVLDGNKENVANATSALVNVTGGALVLEDATLQNNNANKTSDGDRAGGLRVGGGTAVMKSGLITGNTAYYGGGVMVRGGAFRMDGGEIKGNAATNGEEEYGGGGVFIYGGHFQLNGGRIVENTSGGKTIAESNGLAPNEGPDVNFFSGSMATGANADATIGGLYLFDTNNAAVNIYASKNLSVGVAVSTTPPVGGVRRISTAGGHAAGTTVDLSKWTSTADQGIVVVDGGYIALKNEKLDVYVKSTGSDAAAGSEAAPVKTLAEAYKRVAAGGTIHVMDAVTVPAILELRKNVVLTGANKLGVQYPGAALKRGATILLGIYADVKVNNLTLTDSSKGGSSPIGVQANGVLTLGDGAVVTGFASNYAPVFIYPGTGGRVVLEGDAKIYGNTTTSTNTNVSNTTGYVPAAGGGVYVGNKGVLQMDGGQIYGSTNFYVGGGVFVQSGGAFTMNRGRIGDDNTPNVVKGNGGGVYLQTGATFTMTGGELKNNTANNYGGGAYSFGTVRMTGGSITGNTALSGGGVSVRSGSFTMEGGAISGNTAKQSGGGVLAESSSATFTMKGGAISGNKTTLYHGGGVHAYSGGSFRMEGGSITGNTANFTGGGVGLEGSNSNAAVTGGEISGNTAKGTGGGINVSSGTRLTLGGGVKITGNTGSGATQNVYLTNGLYLNVTPALADTASIGVTTQNTSGAGARIGTVTQANSANLNRITQDNGNLEGAYSNGTVIWKLRAQRDVYVKSTGSDANSGTEASPLKTLAQANQMVAEGGVIHVMDAVAVLSRVEIRKNITITGTNGSGAPYAGAALKRGGIQLLSIYSQVQIDHLTLTDGTSNGSNAPVSINSGGTLTLGEGALVTGFRSPFAPVYIFSGSSSSHGAVVMNAGAKITGNTCTTGTCTPSGTGVVASEGGGVFVGQYGSFTMNGGEISANSNSYVGGAVFVGSGATFTMNGGELKNSVSNNYGGAVYSFGTVRMTGGSITGNTALSGGGVSVRSGSFTMEGGSITGNTARQSGGGVLAESSGATFTMKGGTISGNKATSYHGGGVHAYGGGSFRMEGGRITGNTAGSTGGGVGLEGSNSNAAVTGGEISGNTARGIGGGVAVASGTRLTLGGGARVTGNTGGGAAQNVYLAGNINLTVGSALTGTVGVTAQNRGTAGSQFAVLASGLTGENAGLAQFRNDINGSMAAEAVGTAVRWKFKEQSDVYISKDGSDNNPGTQDKPVRTLGVAYQMAAGGGTIHVMDKVPVAASDNIRVDKAVTIRGTGDSGACQLVRVSGNTGRLITVVGGGNVTLEKVSLNGGNLQQNISSRSGGQLAYVSGGTLTLGSGAVLENNHISHTYTDYGSAVYLDGGGIVNIEDGAAIRNNRLTGSYADGAAISSIYGSNTINMRGGEIKGNDASRIGSAIRLSSGTLNMTGGSITKGSVNAAYGTVANTGGVLRMSGGASIDHVYLYSGRTIQVDVALTGSVTGVETASRGLGTQVTTGGASSAAKFDYLPGDYIAAAGTGAGKENNLYLSLKNDYYVASTGDDRNTGTPTKPYATLAKAYSAAPSGATIHIMDEVKQTAGANINANKNFTLVGENNGAKLVRQPGNTGAFITMAGGTVLMKNLVLDGNKGSVTNAASALVNVTGGTLTLENVTLQNNNANATYGGDRAGGLRVGGGKAIMKSGLITGNTALYGGGVMVKGGTFQMDGGEITANAATNGAASYGGGGVFLYGGGFQLNGGRIVENTSGGKTIAQSNGLAPNEGPDVNFFSGSMATGTNANATIGGLYLRGGSTVDVFSSKNLTVGVAVTTAPAKGTVRRISTNLGHTAGTTVDLSKWTPTANQGKVVVENGYIVLSAKSNDATLDRVDRAPFVGEQGYPPVTAAGDPPIYTITVPFAQSAKNFNVSAYPNDAGAKVKSVYTGTDSKVQVSNNGINTWVDYDPSGLAAGAEFATYKYVVTAEDGSTKEYTVKVVRGEPADMGEIVLSVNFDTTQALADAVTYIDVPVFSADDCAKYALDPANENITLEHDNANSRLKVTVKTAYSDEIGTAPGDGWVNSAIQGRFKIDQHLKEMALNYDGAKVAAVKLYTTKISASEATAVDGVVDSFNADGAYDDLYQMAADITDTSHLQYGTNINVENQTEAEKVMAKYAMEVAKGAIDRAFGANYNITIQIYNGTADSPAILTGDYTKGSGAAHKELNLEIIPASFTAADKGTPANPAGKDGLYQFKVVVTMGKQSVTNELSVPVHAHPYAGVSEEELKNALTANDGPFYNTDGSAKLAGTVYVDADATGAVIIAAIRTKMEQQIKGAVTGLTDANITYAVDGSIAIQAQALADGNYTATVTVKATKNSAATTLAVTVPLKMTVKYRPSVDDKVAEAVIQALKDALGADLTFEDLADNAAGDYSSDDAKVKAAVQAELDAAISGLILTEVDASADGETPPHKVSVDLNDYTITSTVGGSFTAPVPGSAANPQGMDGQYIFQSWVSVKKGEFMTTLSPEITESGNPVEPADAGGTAADNGVYITAHPYQGVSDQTAVKLLEALFDGAAQSPSPFVLEYDQRNDAQARTGLVQAWVDGVINGAAEITADGTQYTLSNGRVTKIAGRDLPEGLQITLGASAALKGGVTRFTSTSSAASTANVEDTFTLGFSAGGLTTGKEQNMAFAHKRGAVTGKVSAGSGTAPFTLTFVDSDGNSFTVTTGSDGSYTIPADKADGSYTVIVRDKENKNSTKLTMTLPADARQPDISLQSGAAITGTVKDDKGATVSGAVVTAPGENGGDATASTCPNGRYDLVNVKMGVVDVAAEGAVDGGKATGAASQVTVPTEQPVDITLKTGEMLRGSASPLVKGEVTVYDKDGNVISTAKINPDGSYTLAGIAPSSEYAVSISGTTDTAGTGPAISGCLTGLGSLDGISVPLTDGALLTGVVGNAKASPLDIEAKGAKTSARVPEVQGTRYFLSGLGADSYTVTAVGETPDGTDAFATGTKAVLANQFQAELNLTLAAGSRATGKVELPMGGNGLPAPEYPITLVFVNQDTGEVTTVVTDENGRYDLLLPAGDYQVGIRDKNNSYSGSTQMTSPDHKVLPDASMAYGSLVRGRVTLNGAGVPGASVSLRAVGADGRTVSDQTVSAGVDGLYMAANAAPGSKQPFAAVTSAASGAVVSEVPARSGVDIAMTTGMLVKNQGGQVTVVGGKPAVGADVKITLNGRSHAGVVDSEGNFVIPGVPADWAEKTVTLAASDTLGRRNEAEKEVSAPSGNTAFINLTGGLQIRTEITGTIVGGVTLDDNVTVVSGARVELFYGDASMAAMTTDDNGEFKFEELPYGTYRLVITWNDRIITQEFTLNQTTSGEKLTVVIPSKNINTVVLPAPGIEPMTASIGTGIFGKPVGENTKGFTQAEIEEMELRGGRLELRLEAQPVDEEKKAAEEAKIQAKARNSEIAMMLDLSVFKSVRAAGGLTDRTTKLEEVPENIVTKIRVPQEYQDKTSRLTLYRIHNDGEAETLRDGESCSFLKDETGSYYLEINARKYSTYALTYRAHSSGGDDNDDNDSDVIIAGGSPNTGDISNLTLYLALFCVSMGGLLIRWLLSLRRRGRYSLAGQRRA